MQNMLGAFNNQVDGLGIYDEYKKAKTNSLAALAFKDPSQRQSALAQMAGINAPAAMGMQEKLGEQDKDMLAETTRAMLMHRNNPEIVNQIYARRFVPLMESKLPETAGKYPQMIDERGWQAVQQIANAYGDNKDGDTRWIQTVDKDGKPVWAAATNRGITPTEYAVPDSYSLEIDPATGLPYSHSKRTGTITPAGGGAIESADPMIDVSNRIEQGIQILKANNIPAAQIDAWAEGEFQKGQQLARSGGYVGMSAAEQARAEAQAKAAVELNMAPRIAEANAGVEMRTAPQIAGATEAAKIGAEAAAKMKVAAPAAIAKANGTIALIDKAINHPGRKGATGGSAILPWDVYAGSPQKDFLVVQKQIEGKAFLEAFESLKGGGAITEREGQAATQAMARLDRAQSEGEYLEALKELRAIAASAANRAKSVSGQQAPQSGEPQRIRIKL